MAENVLDACLARELSALTESRGNVYALLSRCYEKEITAEFAAQLANEFRFQSDNAALMAEMDAMRACMSDVDDQGIEQLAVTYNRVFFGMGPLSAKHAFPYESVYTSQRGLMMQEAYDGTRAVYRENRLQKDASFTEPDDHVAVQLAFMKTQCDRACEALAALDEDAATAAFEQQRAFLAEHLLNWMDRFAIEAEAAAREGFYVHLARFTKGFLEDDASVLADILDEEDGSEGVSDEQE